jgi:hypothetical protein
MIARSRAFDRVDSVPVLGGEAREYSPNRRLRERIRRTVSSFKIITAVRDWPMGEREISSPLTVMEISLDSHN